MQALTVQPSTADSLHIDDIPDPKPGADELLVDGPAIGVCGTDKEIARGEYGWAPPSSTQVVLREQ
jgi:glucose 1-dehydrogenase